MNILTQSFKVLFYQTEFFIFCKPQWNLSDLQDLSFTYRTSRDVDISISIHTQVLFKLLTILNSFTLKTHLFSSFVCCFSEKYLQDLHLYTGSYLQFWNACFNLHFFRIFTLFFQCALLNEFCFWQGSIFHKYLFTHSLN